MLERFLIFGCSAPCSRFPVPARLPHAFGSLENLQIGNQQLLRHWEITGQAKIALQTKGEDEILLLQATAQSLNLVARVIQDA
jgi:PTH2 family peptidyl-tRNA hydrolase